MGRWQPLAKSAAAGVALGVGAYLGADVVGDYSTYSILRAQALTLANDSQELKDQIGFPFTTGPWYDARIGFTPGRHVASCTFSLKGTKQITDVSVRAVRRPGYVHQAVYNLLGPGEWKLMDCSAMFPAGGGLVKPRSLLPYEPMPAVATGADGEAKDCTECNKAAEAAGKVPAAAAAQQQQGKAAKGAGGKA